MTSRLDLFKRQLDRWLGGALALLMGLAVANVLWQVFTRFVLGDPSSFTDELARFLLIWIGLLGAAYATGRRLHLAIDLLPTRLRGAARRRLAVFIELSVAAFALLVMVGGGVRLVALTFLLGQTSPALGLPLGYVYVILPVSGVFILFYSLYEVQQQARGAAEAPASPQPK